MPVNESFPHQTLIYQNRYKNNFPEDKEDHPKRTNNKNVIEVLPLLSNETKLSEDTQLF